MNVFWSTICAAKGVANLRGFSCKAEDPPCVSEPPINGRFVTELKGQTAHTAANT